MGKSLYDYEWKYLLQIVNRIHTCTSYEELCNIIFKQFPTTVPFQIGMAFQTRRENGRGIITNPQGYEFPSAVKDKLINGNYPTWSEFIMSPNSSVFRQSDLISPDKWEKTRVYKEIWAPYNAYWGLMVSIVYQDCPLALFGFFREKNQRDFSDRDLYALEALVPTMEIKLYELLRKQPNSSNFVFIKHFDEISSNYGLTKQERNISRLICCGQNDQEICEQLFIAKTTLNKHISNIYKKTGTTSRIQLINLFTS